MLRMRTAMYAFGPFRLDADAEILFRNGEPLPLGKRAVALLRVLIERAGMPVSKDALMEAAWPGLAVEESNLTVQIAALRRVLREEPGGERWIETLPRRGYRFVGPMIANAGNSAVIERQTSAAQDAARLKVPSSQNKISLGPQGPREVFVSCFSVYATIVSSSSRARSCRSLGIVSIGNV